MKKLISYSLWGNNPKYIQGIFENLKGIELQLSDWKAVIYIHKDVDPSVIKEIQENPQVYKAVIMDEDPDTGEQGNKPGWFWRFNALQEDFDYLLCRDSDCRFNPVETMCINDWVNSGKEFHIIRNHRMHGVPILAGLWGCTKSFSDRIDIKSLLDEFKTHPKHMRFGGWDQQFLGEMIYPQLSMSNVMIHDSHHHYKHEEVRFIYNMPFDEHFIGKDYNV